MSQSEWGVCKTNTNVCAMEPTQHEEYRSIRNLAEGATFLSFIRDVPASDLVLTPGFLQPFQANGGIVF
jgi:hypothetical protein